MESNDGFRDELNETYSELKIEWKIRDFFSLCKDHGCYYQSSVFSFVGSSWNLLIFPGGDYTIEDASSGYISVYLEACKLTDLTVAVTYTLGIKRANGTSHNVIVKKRSFTQNFCASGEQKFYQRSELLRHKEELAPTGDLIIICTMKHNSVKNLDVTAPRMKLCELEKLSTDFKNLLRFKSSCDAVISLKDKKFQVHKSVLIARSSVFKSCFEEEKNKTGVIFIDDCDPESFAEFLKYLYTGATENVTSRNAVHLYYISDRYCVKELKHFCVAYMLKHLTPENVLEIFTLTEQHGETELLSAAQIFISRNIVKIFSTVNWETLLAKNRRLASKLIKEMGKIAEVDKYFSPKLARLTKDYDIE